MLRARVRNLVPIPLKSCRVRVGDLCKNIHIH